MASVVKPIVNLFESGVDLIKGGGGPDTLKHFSADDIKTKKWVDDIWGPKPDDTKWDWMNPKKYSQEEGLDVLKMMYPYNDFSQIKPLQN